MKRIEVNKTWKMFVGGAFVRSESGRVYPVAAANGEAMGNACAATRKDLRDAVEAAKKAFPGWAGRSAMNRGQILYRLGEILEGRAAELAEAVRRSTGVSPEAARREVTTAIERTIYYAGWTDKYEAILGGTSPVATPHIHSTATEPMGVVGVIAADFAPLLGLMQQILPAILSGNAAVALASEKFPAAAVLLGEILAVSDVPAGVVNVLTGKRADLLGAFARHEQIRALDFFLSDEEAKEVETGAAESVKRCFWRRGGEESLYGAEAESVYEIRNFLEFKGVWRPYWV